MKTQPPGIPSRREFLRMASLGSVALAGGFGLRPIAAALAGYSHSADRFRAEGDRGWFELREHAFTYRGIGCVTSRGPLHFDPPVNQQAAQMDDFADCILTGRETPVPGELGRRDIRVLAAIYEAAGTGGTVRV